MNLFDKFGIEGTSEHDQFIAESVANLLGSIGSSYGRLIEEYKHMGKTISRRED
jgi:hypothetical protein